MRFCIVFRRLVGELFGLWLILASVAKAPKNRGRMWLLTFSPRFAFLPRQSDGHDWRNVEEVVVFGHRRARFVETVRRRKWGPLHACGIHDALPPRGGLSPLRETGGTSTCRGRFVSLPIGQVFF